jgi:hypothetical protein
VSAKVLVVSPCICSRPVAALLNVDALRPGSPETPSGGPVDADLRIRGISSDWRVLKHRAPLPGLKIFEQGRMGGVSVERPPTPHGVHAQC